MIPLNPHHTATIGKYRVSSLSKGDDTGRWRASVSIRSGHGSATTDRVLRLCGSFDSEAAAHHHAFEQGLIWVAQSRQPGGPSGSLGAN